MSNILFCSVGRRGRLLKDFKKSVSKGTMLVATDNDQTAPGLYFADKQYIVPLVTDPSYLDIILNICEKENIKAVTTLIDPEIEILSKNREEFTRRGILLLCPSAETAEICFDKYKMFEHLRANGINTVLSYKSFDDFTEAYRKKEIDFPVFIKPRTGSGSVGASRIENMKDLKNHFDEGLHDYIIQEFMPGSDLDADVYVDCISNETVSIFLKRKLETRIGGASKTISFRDEKLFEFIREALKVFEIYGPIDVDLFYKDGQYYLSEINPRFGGAYLHAYGAGVDFIKLIENNINGIINSPEFGNYEDGIMMLMYDDVVIRKEENLAKEDGSTIGQKKLYLLGASGHGKVTAEIAEMNGLKPEAFIDDNKSIDEIIGYSVLHQLPEENCNMIVAIGNNKYRKKVVSSLRNPDFISLYHPAASISKRAQIGEGTVVMANVSINSETQIGKHCIINTSCSIDHECKLGDFVHISPKAAVAGNVSIGEGTQIGIGASIIQGVKIGKWCMIGAGAVIIRDVPDYAVVVGNPGRVIKIQE